MILLLLAWLPPLLPLIAHTEGSGPHKNEHQTHHFFSGACQVSKIVLKSLTTISQNSDQWQPFDNNTFKAEGSTGFLCCLPSVLWDHHRIQVQPWVFKPWSWKAKIETKTYALIFQPCTLRKKHSSRNGRHVAVTPKKNQMNANNR